MKHSVYNKRNKFIERCDVKQRTSSLATTEIARDADETATQGHPRSSVVVPIATAYMTSY